MDLTLTGIDDRTTPAEIRLLHGRGVELGILYTETPEGRNRYPSLSWIERTVSQIPGRYSLHVCGRKARERLFNYDLGYCIGRFQRIQINGKINEAELLDACSVYRGHTIITQANPGHDRNPRDCGLANHAVLVDGSGGRGLSPAEWLRPNTPRAVGFAGGLGPHNLRRELPRIKEVATEPTWIDMEARLRSESDWFSIAAAMAAVDEFIAATSSI